MRQAFVSKLSLVYDCDKIAEDDLKMVQDGFKSLQDV